MEKWGDLLKNIGFPILISFIFIFSTLENNANMRLDYMQREEKLYMQIINIQNLLLRSIDLKLEEIQNVK